MIAAKLRGGDEVRVVSPATSLGFIPEDQRETAAERLARLGLKTTYSKNGEILDRFDSAPVEARVSDLHDAFSDPEVAGMLTTLERVMNLGENRIGKRILRLARSPAVPRFPHSQAIPDRVHNSL
jgi:LD-carboxypeptidase N-terminal domain